MKEDTASRKITTEDEEPEDRDALVARLLRAAPALVAAGLDFHAAVAESVGLSLTDLRYLHLVTEGPVTAGDLARRTGLTTGAVTRVIDRLQRAGFVRRAADPSDRRRVIVEPVPERMAELSPRYAGMAAAWQEVLSRYDDSALRVIMDLFEQMQVISRREADRLRLGAA